MTNLRKRLRSSERKDWAQVSWTGPSQLLPSQQECIPGAWGKAKGFPQHPGKGQTGQLQLPREAPGACPRGSGPGVLYPLAHPTACESRVKTWGRSPLVKLLSASKKVWTRLSSGGKSSNVTATKNTQQLC